MDENEFLQEILAENQKAMDSINREKQEQEIREFLRINILDFLQGLRGAGIELYNLTSNESKDLCIIKDEEIDIRLSMFLEKII